MKKILTYILLVTAASLIFTACAENELCNSENPFRNGTGSSGQTDELTYLEATLGDTPTKTAMSAFDGSWKTLWQSEDKIAVFFDGSSSAVDFRLERGEGQNTGVFSGNATGNIWTALYPAIDAESKIGTCINFYLPERQTYAEGSFGPDSYPMVAAPTSGMMRFRNLCSTIKVQLKGHHVVDSIKFTANEKNISVCGPASVDVDFTDEPSLKMGSGGSGSITLDVGGVLIDPDEITDFYIVLPAQTYRGGFTLKIFTQTGSMTRSTSSDVTIERSKVHALTPFYVKLEDGPEPSVALEGSGTETSPLLIRTIPDLLTMISSVNANANVRNSEGKKIDATTAAFRLESDIDLSPLCSKSGKSWTPIGGKTPFSGVFDGNGHKLSNLYIDTDKPKAGLFGYLTGTVRNLTVSGTVTSSNTIVGMIAGHLDCTALIENCTTYGEVSSSYNDIYVSIGGIAGTKEQFSKISDCRNYATIEGYDSAGGIVGYNIGEITGCFNFGTIKTYSYGGGVVGFTLDGSVYNCFNCGNIEGIHTIGGICGGIYLNSKFANCINSGDVSAEQGDIGGIFGYSEGNEKSSVQNCVNVGNILTPESFTGNKGGIAGRSIAKVQNCYWLYDAQAKLGIKDGGVINESSYCFALTSDQIKGVQPFQEPLYYNKKGVPSLNAIDALNNWAADNSGEYTYWGWAHNEGDEWLSFTGEPAKAQQGDVSDLFIVLPSEVSVSYEESDFEVKAIAGMGHKLSSMPDWISVSGTHVTEAGGVTTTTYSFKAQANPDYEKRSEAIVLCNDAQQCVPVTVTQMEKIAESDIWKIKNFYHRSVGFRFTATWCPYCPAMTEEWYYAKNFLGDKFQIAAFHPTSSDLGFAGTPKMESAYHVSDYPDGIIDGRAKVRRGGITLIGPVTEETVEAYGTSSGIEFVSKVNGNTVDLDVRLYIHEKGDYKVTALLLEDNIIGGQQDERYGYSSDFKHDNIVRLAFSEVTGDKFTLNTDNSIVPFEYSGEIPSQCRKENLRILVYVERAYGSLQKVNKCEVTYLDFNDYFVDNANTAALGQKAEITFDDSTGKDEKYESKDYSADGKVTKLQSASVGKGIDIVITGDAFADKNQMSFDAYADRAMEAFFAVEPYNSLRNRFNVWSINAVSKNDYIGGDTKFSVTLGEGTYVEGDSDKIFSFVGDNLPSVDFTKTLIIVLANKAAYAGTCHFWIDNAAISYVPLQTSYSEFDATLRHESAGHGFGKLDDEYSYDRSAPSDWIASRKEWQKLAYGFWENIDFTDDPEIIRWKIFLKDSRYAGQVGIFEGGGTYATGVWRPTGNSIMRYNYGFFNAPSREAIYKKIMRFSEGDSWKYDYETFVEFDAKGRKEEAAYYAVTKAYRTPVHKEVVPLHPPVLRER